MNARLVPIIAAVLLATSCSSSSETTTTTMPVPLNSSTTTRAAPSSTTTTSTTLAPSTLIPSFPEYRIVQRIVAPDTGDIVVLLLDPQSYTSLSDLDLYDVIADAADRFPPIFEAYVVDSQAAADAVLLEDPDADQLRELDAHYLARLEEGFRIVYVGPFEDSEEAVLGS